MVATLPTQSDAFSTLDNTQQLVSLPEAAIQAHLTADRVNLHTTTVGIILQSDGNRVTVQPALRSVMRDGAEVPLPMLLDVPIMWPQGGGLAMTFPVRNGDECVVFFTERALDLWQQYGGLQTPEFRLHDLRDAFAFVGVNSDPNKLVDVSQTAAEIRTLDGSTKISIEPNVVTIVAPLVNIQGNLNVTGTTTHLPQP